MDFSEITISTTFLKELQTMDHLNSAIELTIAACEKILDNDTLLEDKEIVELAIQNCITRAMDIGFADRSDLNKEEARIANLRLRLARKVYTNKEEALIEALESVHYWENDSEKKSYLAAEIKQLKK